MLLHVFQELYARLHIHKIAAVCYIRDDDQHLLCIKFGKNCSVMYMIQR